MPLVRSQPSIRSSFWPRMTTATCRALRKKSRRFSFAPDGMTAPHRERVAVGIEQLAVKSLEGVADADDQIDGARELGGEDRRTAPRHDVEPDVRGQRGDLLHQRRHQEFDREIRHHQAKAPLAAGGVEIVRNEQPAHLIERLRQRPAQRPGPAASIPSARRSAPAADRRACRAAAAAHGSRPAATARSASPRG